MSINKPLLIKVSLLFLLLLSIIAVVLDRVFPLKQPFAPNGQFATTVLDSSGRPLRAFADSQGVWRHRVSLAQVSNLYIQALLNYEDRYFYYHFGINPMAILRAIWLNLTHGRMISGGSTLSMQVARLLHPHSRTIAGKLYQMLRTLQLEWHYSKAEILTIYINLAPFGGTIEGVQSASYSYLDKDASDLTHAEAALLAVLPQAPTRYRPDLHPHKAQQARDKVLDRLASKGVWSRQVVEEAKIEQVEPYRAPIPMLAPLLARRLKQQLNQAVIHTTIDGEWQQALESQLKRYTERLPKGASGALLVVDNHTGAVKAYLGSADLNDASRFGHVDMIEAIRSPGSTLKPFLFAFALEQGLIHSHSLLADVPLIDTEYRPSNFGGGFQGPVSATEALQRSLNIPFVTLLKHLGPQWFADRLAGAGLTLQLADHQPTLAMILGGAGANLQQLVASYAALSNQGQALQLKFLASQLQKPKHQRFLTTPGAAWVTHQTLAQIAPPSAVDSFAHVRLARQIAWKTGTSYGFRDSWAIGTSKDYTVGVWIGRPDNSPMPGHYGRKTAAPLLFSVFNYIEPHSLLPPMPEGVSQEVICWPLGGLKSQQSEYCHRSFEAWIVEQTIPQTLTDPDKPQFGLNPLPYWINLDNGLRIGAQCQSAGIHRALRNVPVWPANLVPWLPPKWRLSQLLPPSSQHCASPLPNSGQHLAIKGIVDGSVYRHNGERFATVRLQAIGAMGAQHWYINGDFYKTVAADGHINYQFERLGKQQILVIDDNGFIAKAQVEVIR